MNALLAMELNKAYRNLWFYLVLGVMTAIAVASAFGCISYIVESGSYSEHINYHNYMMPYVSSPYRWWISLDFLSPFSILFYQLAPLLCAAVYSWSYRSEYDAGYLNQVYTRASRCRYLASKAFATFCVGASVVIIPQIINICVLACYLPLYTPSVVDQFYLGVNGLDYGSELFYQVPLLFVALHLLVSGIIGGSWAVFVLGCATVVKNRVVLMVAPYVCLRVFSYLTELFFITTGLWGFQVGLSENMRAAVSSYAQPLQVIAVEVLLLLGGSYLLVRRALKKDVL